LQTQKKKNTQREEVGKTLWCGQRSTDWENLSPSFSIDAARFLATISRDSRQRPKSRWWEFWRLSRSP
jgi:hypothetical protein